MFLGWGLSAFGGNVADVMQGGESRVVWGYTGLIGDEGGGHGEDVMESERESFWARRSDIRVEMTSNIEGLDGVRTF